MPPPLRLANERDDYAFSATIEPRRTHIVLLCWLRPGNEVGRPGLSIDRDHESLFLRLLRLQLAENPGSFLSLGASLSESARFALFTGSVGVIVLSLLCVTVFARRLDLRRVVAMALVAGGGIGNIIDRLRFDGQVTDFLNVGIGSLRTGIFNVADMAILSGALLLIFNWKDVNANPDRAAP